MVRLASIVTESIVLADTCCGRQNTSTYHSLHLLTHYDDDVLRCVWSICAFDQTCNAFSQWHLMKQRCIFLRRAKIRTALFLFYLITAHRHWPNALHIWSNAQTDQTRLTMSAVKIQSNRAEQNRSLFVHKLKKQQLNVNLRTQVKHLIVRIYLSKLNTKLYVTYYSY